MNTDLLVAHLFLGSFQLLGELRRLLYRLLGRCGDRGSTSQRGLGWNDGSGGRLLFFVGWNLQPTWKLHGVAIEKIDYLNPSEAGTDSGTLFWNVWSSIGNYWIWKNGVCEVPHEGQYHRDTWRSCWSTLNCKSWRMWWVSHVNFWHSELINVKLYIYIYT